MAKTGNKKKKNALIWQHIVLNNNNGALLFFTRHQTVLVNAAIAVSVECDLTRLRLMAQIDDVSCQTLAQSG